MRRSIFCAVTVMHPVLCLGINGADWEISGDGDYPFAFTDMTDSDTGRYTARAGVLAYSELDEYRLASAFIVRPLRLL